MSKRKTILSTLSEKEICTVQQDKSNRAATYNNTNMSSQTYIAREGFAKRLIELRQAKGVSGREMSLSLGQGAGYINNLENDNNLPSMAMFFEICEYLDITPEEFFAYTGRKMSMHFAMALENLPADEQGLLLTLAEKLGNK